MAEYNFVDNTFIKAFGISEDDALKSRVMFFDLKMITA